jgi:molybdopterin converting factor small subunit
MKWMSVATVRLNGLLNADAGVKNTCTVYFRGKRMKLKEVLSKIAWHVPEKAVAFFAINGVKAVEDSWVMNGDVIDIFPVVAGG